MTRERRSPTAALRMAFSQLARMPLRYWGALFASHAVMGVGVPLVTGLLFEAALESAGLPALTDESATGVCPLPMTSQHGGGETREVVQHRVLAPAAYPIPQLS